ncbi:glycoside hydrolase family 31 protein [Puniceicoccus vermicola]|uniref:Alpha-glucosidase n=1 Tax=Puniceicoccus vermicola TaxID=388746 RepID=A0A7X1E657_9BACT|nr:TIM-barrel domain-containing protein [Puniceicoccus vermicola]MBC2604325.1 hypothetical protein [Puniceicoccus vermicola]
MHFHKYPFPYNFEFISKVDEGRSIETSQGPYELQLKAFEDDVFQIKVTGAGWETQESQSDLQLPTAVEGLESETARITLTRHGQLSLETVGGQNLLSSGAGRFFGQCGEASMFEFLREDSDCYYGMGEKWSSLEHTGKKVKFWNTDVWADFHPNSFVDGNPPVDPAYLSIPYLIVKRGSQYIGLLLDNPFSSFISTKSTESVAGQMEVKGESERFYLGSEEGQPNLILILGPSLPELTRKVQKLMGTTPLPPAWSLGYQQCRWGYESEADLMELDRKFSEHEIPVDGLWLDIEYMRGYRVFTTEPDNFSNFAETLKTLDRRGRKVVPIIDPGVKRDPDYGVYQRGREHGAFCLNPQGLEYIGLVWPGQTAFPDFSIPEGCDWWANEVANFVAKGVHGAWLDMNDPATGAVENAHMLFNKGTKSHSSFHNQYALGMARASREGFLKAFPDQRPFLLSRSGFTGSGRYTAIWTGDNFSNYHHLKSSIPTTLNLALSGIPFNGPDAAGFGGDTWPELIRDWFKAGFLFPIFRNHCMKGNRSQEPWAFDEETLEVTRRYIRLRYRLRPYLYQLFAAQEELGEAILRPLFYNFASTPELPLEKVQDQFLVGDSILQAPFVEEGQTERDVILPGERFWFDCTAGEWISGNQKQTVQATLEDTPIYVHDRCILPLARIGLAESGFYAEKADFQIFLSEDGEAETRYVFDDGHSFAYQKGKRSIALVKATRQDSSLTFTVHYPKTGYGEGDFTFTTESSIESVTLNGKELNPADPQGVPLTAGSWKTWA